MLSCYIWQALYRSLHVSLCLQGLDVSEQGLNLISNVIHKLLDIDCAVLMGANIAPEVARENYCEATIGKWERQ